MRAAFFAMLAIGMATAVSAGPAQALRGELPFCMKGQGVGNAHGDCSYWTYEQCLETASGRFNYCDANPFYVGNEPPPVRRPSRHHRHYY